MDNLRYLRNRKGRESPRLTTELMRGSSHLKFADLRDTGWNFNSIGRIGLNLLSQQKFESRLPGPTILNSMAFQQLTTTNISHFRTMKRSLAHFLGRFW